METMTDCATVLAHLQKYGSITAKEAMDRYGIMRLGARIFDLRAQGIYIKTFRKSMKNRFGHSTSYAVYVYGEANVKSD